MANAFGNGNGDIASLISQGHSLDAAKAIFLAQQAYDNDREIQQAVFKRIQELVSQGQTPDANHVMVWEVNKKRLQNANAQPVTTVEKSQTSEEKLDKHDYRIMEEAKQLIRDKQVPEHLVERTLEPIFERWEEVKLEERESKNLYELFDEDKLDKQLFEAKYKDAVKVIGDSQETHGTLLQERVQKEFERIKQETGTSDIVLSTRVAMINIAENFREEQKKAEEEKNKLTNKIKERANRVYTTLTDKVSEIAERRIQKRLDKEVEYLRSEYGLDSNTEAILREVHSKLDAKERKKERLENIWDTITEISEERAERTARDPKLRGIARQIKLSTKEDNYEFERYVKRNIKELIGKLDEKGELKYEVIEDPDLITATFNPEKSVFYSKMNADEKEKKERRKHLKSHWISYGEAVIKEQSKISEEADPKSEEVKIEKFADSQTDWEQKAATYKQELADLENKYPAATRNVDKSMEVREKQKKLADAEARAVDQKEVKERVSKLEERFSVTERKKEKERRRSEQNNATFIDADKVEEIRKANARTKRNNRIKTAVRYAAGIAAVVGLYIKGPDIYRSAKEYLEREPEVVATARYNPSTPQAHQTEESVTYVNFGAGLSREAMLSNLADELKKRGLKIDDIEEVIKQNQEGNTAEQEEDVPTSTVTIYTDSIATKAQLAVAEAVPYKEQDLEARLAAANAIIEQQKEQLETADQDLARATERLDAVTRSGTLHTEAELQAAIATGERRAAGEYAVAFKKAHESIGAFAENNYTFAATIYRIITGEDPHRRPEETHTDPQYWDARNDPKLKDRWAMQVRYDVKLLDASVQLMDTIQDQIKTAGGQIKTANDERDQARSRLSELETALASTKAQAEGAQALAQQYLAEATKQEKRAEFAINVAGKYAADDARDKAVIALLQHGSQTREAEIAHLEQELQAASRPTENTELAKVREDYDQAQKTIEEQTGTIQELRRKSEEIDRIRNSYETELERRAEVMDDFYTENEQLKQAVEDLEARAIIAVPADLDQGTVAYVKNSFGKLLRGEFNKDDAIELRRKVKNEELFYQLIIYGQAANLGKSTIENAQRIEGITGEDLLKDREYKTEGTDEEILKSNLQRMGDLMHFMEKLREHMDKPYTIEVEERNGKLYLKVGDTEKQLKKDSDNSYVPIEIPRK